MKSAIDKYTAFKTAIRDNRIVWLFGTGISAALTGKSYSWWKWMQSGIEVIKDGCKAGVCKASIEADPSVDNMVAVIEDIIDTLQSEGTYDEWMQLSFETNALENDTLSLTLKKLLITQDIFATTNYDRLLEQATGLESYTYGDAAEVFKMIEERKSSHVLHLHGMYDSRMGIDNIIASKKQYESIVDNEGAQFIQNVLGTRTLVFVGCGQTAEDVNISKFITFAHSKLNLDVDYYFLIKEGAVINGLPENVHLIPYGDDFSDLPAFLEDIAQERLKGLMQRNPVVGRTAYGSPDATSSPLSLYHYAQQNIPFCGRCDEMQNALNFVMADNDFCWWAVTGQAGAGKSRFALELLHRLPPTWYGFFLDDRIASIENHFTPFANTLVVIDYVCEREMLIAAVLRELQNKFIHEPYRLRVLLLERDNERSAGTWYAKLIQFMGRYDNFKSSEYKNHFLNLSDLREDAVEEFIGHVCRKEGLPEDTNRNALLRKEYKRKFEHLHYRPLYVQMFVEGWIGNDCYFPNYDSFTDLIKQTLDKEQRRWMEIFDNDQRCCNALIRLMIRANITGFLEEKTSDRLYKEDWQTLNRFIAGHTLPGVQREESKMAILSSVCQNIAAREMALVPMFPDIIKEYMFCYYMDDSRLPAVMKEVWHNAAQDFSVFIRRCMTDFPGNDFYTKALNIYEESSRDYQVLVGRLELLRKSHFCATDNYSVEKKIIFNEYAFWKAIKIPDGHNQEQEVLSWTKVEGLALVAQHIGAMSVYDLTLYMSVIEEMLGVSGGKVVDIIKQMHLQNFINTTATAGFYEESNCLTKEMERLLATQEEDEELGVLHTMNLVVNINSQIMNAIIYNNDFSLALKLLSDMVAKCRVTEIEIVERVLQTGFRFDYLAFSFHNEDYFGKGHAHTIHLTALFPADSFIQMFHLAGSMLKLHKRFLWEDETKELISQEMALLDTGFRNVEFDDNGYRNEQKSVMLGLFMIFNLNFITDKTCLYQQIEECDKILRTHPQLSDIAQAKLQSIRKLHKDFLKDKISRDEVNESFRHLEKNPESESLRDTFFELLEESTEAGNKRNYLSRTVVTCAVHDAMYNVLNKSGIDEVDAMFGGYSDGLFNTPYVRSHQKINPNEKCPCGSGRKFKKCCKGKGIYD